MARKKTAKKKSDKRGRRRCEIHVWRDWSSTHTSWLSFGKGYQIHRSCFDCSLIEWVHFIPAKSDTEIGQQQVQDWISNQK